MVELFGFEADFLDWSDFAMTAYIVIHLFFLWILMLFTCHCRHGCCSNCFGEWRSVLWERRGIYLPIILQWFDQATDIGILILWYQLWQKEENNEDFEVDHVNVQFFFGLSVLCLLVYRITIIIAVVIADNYDNKRCVPLFLSLFDFIFIYEVYFVHSQNLPELSEDMRNYQLLECIFESIPQITFQSVFVLRTWPNKEQFDTNFSEYYSDVEYLLLTSIIISCLNIVNKYTWRDHHTQWVDDECKFEVNVGYWFVHIIWRVAHILARIILVVLMWSVLGGLLLSLFFFIVFIIFMICYNKYEYDASVIKRETGFEPTQKEIIFSGVKAFVTTHVIGMTGDDTPTSKILGFRMMMRLCEYIVGIGLIWSFVEYRDSLTCPKYVCSSAENRDVDANPMINIYLYTELISVTIDFLLFFIMLYAGLIQRDSDKSYIPSSHTLAVKSENNVDSETQTNTMNNANNGNSNNNDTTIDVDNNNNNTTMGTNQSELEMQLANDDDEYDQKMDELDEMETPGNDNPPNNDNNNNNNNNNGNDSIGNNDDIDNNVDNMQRNISNSSMKAQRIESVDP